MPRGRVVAQILLAGLLVPAAASARPPLGEQEAASAAQRFGQALLREDAPALKALLPRQGKVRARLEFLGPAQGSLSAEQLTALIQDFMRRGRVGSFEVVRTEVDEARLALVQGVVTLVDREGRKHSRRLDLSFQPEAGSWVLREIREAPP